MRFESPGTHRRDFDIADDGFFDVRVFDVILLLVPLDEYPLHGSIFEEINAVCVIGNETGDIPILSLPVVSHNKVWGNCLGVFLLSDIEAGGSGQITVQHNRVSANNNFCPVFEGFLPDLGGGGIVLAGSQHDIIFQNIVTDNRGNTLFSGGIVLITNTLPNPDGSFDVSKDNLVALNKLSGNEPGDIVTDATSTPNVFVRNRCDTSIPDGLCGF